MSNNPLKKLAGETAIYGLSTILARVVNFIFVPIYTYNLSTESYGVATEFLAYIAILQVLFTLGLETGCFRFANKTEDPNKVFSNALITTGFLSLSFFTVTTILSGKISAMLGYPGYNNIIIYVAAILAIDSTTAILFARLRFENRPIKFATYKSIKILGETSFNLILFFAIPGFLVTNPDSLLTIFISPSPDFTYILFAIFLSAILSILLFVPDITRLKLQFTPHLWRQMMLYSLPIMIAGLPGILNDFADRILFRFFSPEGNNWLSDLGVFQAGVKIAVIMNLFIQMFRFAAEPFFFAREKEKESGKLYASVMVHFTAFGTLIFMGILFYIDILQYLIGKDFREGLSIVPIMLLSYLILGITFNVSMWYKLSGKTKYAIVVTSSGLPVTLAINMLLMPHFSYMAAAWAHLASYSAMLATSIYLGNKHYPIPYNWKKITGYLLYGIILYALTIVVPQNNVYFKYIFRTLLIILYIISYLKTEKINLWKSKS